MILEESEAKRTICIKLPWHAGDALVEQWHEKHFYAHCDGIKNASSCQWFLNMDTALLVELGWGILVICLEQCFDYFICVFQYSTYDLSSYLKLM